MGHSYVGSTNILLRLISEGQALLQGRYKNAGVNIESLKRIYQRRTGRRGAPAQGLTPRSKHIIEVAAAEAARLKTNYIGTEHLLMAIIRESDCFATRMLVASGVDITRLYRDIESLIGSTSPQGPQASQQPRQPRGHSHQPRGSRNQDP